MIVYASRTGTKRNLALLRKADWRILVSRAGVWRTEGFPYALDNGAWSDFQAGRQFDEEAFERLVDKFAGGADWLVLPDIVEGGLRSLELSLRWLNRGLSMCKMVLIAVQDGMTSADVEPFVGSAVGIFLGGSTAWKLKTMRAWGEFCDRVRCYFHVGRVNTAKRMFLAIEAGADSVDGSNASRFAVNIPMLDAARRHRDFFAVRETA